MKQRNHYAIVVSQFNTHITLPLLEGALSRLKECGIKKEEILIVHVPGAVEIPLIAQIIAEKKQVAAIICLGAVIRGETDHYQYVCEQVSQGCQTVMLKYNIPVIFGILTTLDEEQAIARIGGNKGHLGKTCADTAIQMAQLCQRLHESNDIEKLQHALSE
jgi:6,7-dimethyl-8-ribityllumazine synthase